MEYSRLEARSLEARLLVYSISFFKNSASNAAIKNMESWLQATVHYQKIILTIKKGTGTYIA
jgi:hypothetical protein